MDSKRNSPMNKSVYAHKCKKMTQFCPMFSDLTQHNTHTTMASKNFAKFGINRFISLIGPLNEIHKLSKQLKIVGFAFDQNLIIGHFSKLKDSQFNVPNVRSENKYGYSKNPKVYVNLINTNVHTVTRTNKCVANNQILRIGYVPLNITITNKPSNFGTFEINLMAGGKDISEHPKMVDPYTLVAYDILVRHEKLRKSYM